MSTYTLSCLMSAALELPRCCIVIANLSGSYVAQTKAIAEAISNLQQEASRQASTITPVQLAGTCSSLAPLRLDAGRFSLASRFRPTEISAVTLSPELQTRLLPATPVWVGNEWWNSRFRRALTCGTE
ncbi:hypothetical protein KPNIH19_28512, partial [Klebsiella pneumoniae subsp. pneumoniae KPNIH19]